MSNPCYAMLCYALPCHSMPCSAVWCRALSCAVPCRAMHALSCYARQVARMAHDSLLAELRATQRFTRASEETSCETLAYQVYHSEL